MARQNTATVQKISVSDISDYSAPQRTAPFLTLTGNENAKGSKNLSHPIIQAFGQIEHGHLTIITPEAERLEFGSFESGPVALLRLRDWKVLDELLARGEVGFAEAFITGRWDSPDLAALLTLGLLNTNQLEQFLHGKAWYVIWQRVRDWLRFNTKRRARSNVVAHYDLGNDFYSLWLDASMTYSGALFGGDDSLSLEEAQAAKYNRILNKLSPKPGEHILEIGCGWGGFAEAAARRGVKVTGVTLSDEQAAYARKRLQDQGLDYLATIELKDYRDVEGQYDYIVSIGMFEHVGERHWATYMQSIKKHLKHGGKAIIQSITLDDALFEKLDGTVGFIETYIFPGGMLPSKARFKKAATAEGLDCKEMFGFGRDYARTLTHWLERFDNHRQQIINMGYSERFIRMWRFYLSSCIASFLSKRSDVMQAELMHRS